jgi:large subunit ribosomal protein L23
MISIDKILIAPVLSEKTNRLREKGKYVFRVDPRATKRDIKEACRRLWNVHPESCAVCNVAPKPKRQRYKRGYTSAWKKAIVKLPEGEKIAVFEGV